MDKGADKKIKGKSWGGKSLNDDKPSSSTPIDNNVGTRIYKWKDGFTTTVIYGKGPTVTTDWSDR